MGHTCCCKGFPDALQGLPWVAVGSLSAADDSAEDGTAAETRATGLGKQAIKELVDVDVALVERRLAACATQLRMAVPVTCSAAPNPPQTPGQGGAQASLSTASSMAKSAVPGPRLGLQIFRQLPAWALSGPALPPVRTLFGSRPGWRPLLKVAYTRQGTISCVGGLPRLA
ncbi:hypothetical protein CVIRNUC_010527 [Coccomyxa viridis]|uniref:Uncharacterized protein n=1 Tax=Coccomyxa viridis TaxID=1274662 RepID=A0AAV1IMV3_9CHLO|nr:hypothetical protein CVIRNUC_010527 [Coccomyxa viridis]